MRISARPDDKDYRLRGLAATTFVFRTVPGARPLLNGSEAEIFDYLKDHPGSSVDDLRTHIPALGEPGYEAYVKARDLVVGMVDRNLLETCGELPLEQVDTRYERVPACDICGSPSDNHSIVLWKHNTPMVECTECGMIYANPRWKGEHLFGRYTPDYWEHYSELICNTALDPVANRQKWAHFLHLIEPVRQTGKLLDIGCATGEFLLAAGEQGWDTYGVETSPIGAALAERVPGAHVHIGTLDTAHYPEGSFDAITMYDVIEHLQSPTAYVQQVVRLLRPGGFFVLLTPNVGSLAYRLLGRRWEPVGPNDHVYLFGPRTMERLLTNSGFAIHLMDTMNSGTESWRKWLDDSRLKALAPLLLRAAEAGKHRFLTGDVLFVIARRMDGYDLQA